jgi:hypothetical protein
MGEVPHRHFDAAVRRLPHDRRVADSEERGVVMRKARLFTLVLAFGVVAALPAVAQANHDATATGRANLHPLALPRDEDNGALPGTLSGIRARFTFVDDGATITMSGEAWGMDPALTYVSAVSDNGSVPGGFFAFGGQGATKGACEAIEWEDPVGLAGTWVVDADGRGTITGTNFVDGVYVGLEDFDTIQIRLLESDFDAPLACGQVTTHPAD